MVVCVIEEQAAMAARVTMACMMTERGLAGKFVYASGQPRARKRDCRDIRLLKFSSLVSPAQ